MIDIVAIRVEVREGFPDTEIIINCPRNDDSIARIVAVIHALDQKLLGRRDGRVEVIDWHEVLYLESVDKHAFIYTPASVYETELRLYEFEDQFANVGFFRTSKSQIVSLARVASLRPEFGGRMELTMDNGERLIVSRKYVKPLKERLGLR